MQFTFELVPILVLAIFQSVFGIGLLLFGTPFFLFIEYSFSETLILLLPISITISFMQVIFSKEHNLNFIKNLNFYTLPFVIIFLMFSLHFEEIINFKLFVAVMLIISSLVMIMRERFIYFRSKIINKQSIFLSLIGVIHGLTNMGGSFLSIYSFIINDGNKVIARSTISYGYLAMGIIQFCSMLIYNQSVFNDIRLIYILLAVLIYFPSQYVFNYLYFINFYFVISYTALIFGFFVILNNFFM
ncbi:hypothetical protein N9V16_01895 [SAR116 cluster bacterium]|nr:hypothetical protein [SAR116 cluster bacterium]